MKICKHPGCENSFKDHRWGSVKAHDDGWLQLKNGDAWCPEHFPAWASKWRDKKSNSN